MGKKKRRFYPQPDDDLNGKTDDEEMDSDNEKEPILSSDDSLYESETDHSETDYEPESSATSEDDGLDASVLHGTGKKPYRKYTKTKSVTIDRSANAPSSESSSDEESELQGTSTQLNATGALKRMGKWSDHVRKKNKQTPAQALPVQMEIPSAPTPNASPLNAGEPQPVHPPPRAPPPANSKPPTGLVFGGRAVLNMPSKAPKTRKDVLAKIAAGADSYECPVCHILLLSESSQKRHMEAHFKAKEDKPILPCPRCGKEYKCKSALENHVADSECWRKWYEGPLPPDPAPVEMEPPEDGEPLQDFSKHNPGMLFSHFFNPLLEPWKKHTNLAGKKIYTKERAKKFKRSPWAWLRKLEAYKFMTMFLAWGLLGLDRVRDPWKDDWLFHNPFYSTWTSGNRFEQIVHATHFVDNEYETKNGRRGCVGSDNYDRLWRIRDVINEFCRISQASWNPGRNLSIDEMMVLFKGRWGHVTLMPKKPIKKGIKLFAMADAKTGYVLNFIPSTGEHYPEYPLLKKTGATIVGLLRSDNLPAGTGRSYLYKGHYLFTDNYYTAFKTIEWLRMRGIYYCGTIRKDKRRVPVFMTEAVHSNGRQFARGEMKFAHSNTGVQLCVWLDSKTVITASNIPNVTDDYLLTERVLTYKHKKKKVYLGTKLIPIPEVVWLYNQFMKGIDISDQLIAKCHHQFKTKKWFIPIWYEIIDMCILNSFIIYKYYYKKNFPEAPPLTTPVFRRMVVDSLRSHIEAVEKPADRLPKGGNVPVVVEMPHARIPEAETLNIKKLSWLEKVRISKRRLDHKNYTHRVRSCRRARCHVHMQEKSAFYTCSECKIPMCVNPCMERFHHSLYYKYNDRELGSRKEKLRKKHVFLAK